MFFPVHSVSIVLLSALHRSDSILISSESNIRKYLLIYPGFTVYHQGARNQPRTGGAY